MIHLGHVRVADSREVLVHFLFPAIPIERRKPHDLPTHQVIFYSLPLSWGRRQYMMTLFQPSMLSWGEGRPGHFWIPFESRYKTWQKNRGAFNYVLDCFSPEVFISLGVSSIYFWAYLTSLSFCHSKVLDLDGEFFKDLYITK